MRLKHLFALFLISLFSLNLSAISSDKIPVVDSLELLIEESNNPYTLIESYSQLCWILRSRDPEQAIIYGNKALQLIKKNPKFSNMRAETLNYLGVVNRNKGDYGNAMEYYFEALKDAEENNNNIQIAYSNNNLGGIFTLKGDYIDAIDYLKKAFHFFSAENNLKGMGYACVNIGNLYRHTNEIEEGINYFDKAIVYKQEVNDTIGVAITMNLKAIALYDSEHFKEAHELYIELQNLYVNNKDEKGLSVIKNYLGLIETSNGNYHKAIKYFKESIEICEKIYNNQGIALAKINSSIPYCLSKQKTKAFNILDEGFAIAREIGDLELIKLSYSSYSKIYYSHGDYKLAYDYKTKYQKTHDQHLDNLTRERISSLRINNELEKKKSHTEYLEKRTTLLEENVSLAEEKLKLQHYLVASLVIIILMILIPLIVLFRKNKSKLSHNEDLISKNKELQESNETRERFLSIIGHDLKNPFNSVLGLTSLVIDEWDSLPNDEKLNILNEVQSSSNSIYELMDNLLLWAKNQSGTINAYPERFNLNENIVDVYEIFRNQATYKQIKIELNIGSTNYVSADPDMINTVLRNLISNAVKFTRKGGKIAIELKKLSTEVEFSITDNGKGIPPEDLKRILDDRKGFTTKGTSQESGTGLGLLVVRDFVEKNNGVFWIESKVGIGSRFCFTLPDRL